MKALAVILGTILFVVLGGVAYIVYDSKIEGKNQQLSSDVRLVTQEGVNISLSALYTRPSIVLFGFTHCSKVCPTTLSKLDGWLKKVDPTGKLLNAYFITVDPKRDTPEEMNKFVKKFSDRIIGISGDPTSVMSVVKKFRVYVNNVLTDQSDPEKKYFVDHTTALLLFNTSGSIVGIIPYKEDSQFAIEKINRLMEQEKYLK